jgi:hypothetical protein
VSLSDLRFENNISEGTSLIRTWTSGLQGQRIGVRRASRRTEDDIGALPTSEELYTRYDAQITLIVRSITYSQFYSLSFWIIVIKYLLVIYLLYTLLVRLTLHGKHGNIKLVYQTQVVT